MPIELSIAKRIAAGVVARLEPHCERIEFAGSIRRGRPWVKDIDLVAIPRMSSSAALFGASRIADTDFLRALLDIAEKDSSGGATECTGEKLIRTTVPARLAPSGAAGAGGPVGDIGLVSLDCYIATAETWATLLLIRTGSAEHNVWLCQRARQCGGKLHADGSGLELPGQYDPYTQRTINQRIVRPQTEEEIFKALGLPALPPQIRECVNGRPVWL